MLYVECKGYWLQLRINFKPAYSFIMNVKKKTLDDYWKEFKKIQIKIVN